MTDIVYSELTERYWLVADNQKCREITDYMKKHDAEVRARVIDECIEAIEYCITQNECIDMLEDLKEQKND